MMFLKRSFSQDHHSKLFIIILCLIVAPLQGTHQTTYIIVHGTWAQHEIWAQPGGNFFESLQRSLEPFVTMSFFTWSGKNDHAARYRAAQELAFMIKTLPLNTTISIVAHSHGANVCFLASQLLIGNNHHIATLYALGAPIDRTNYLPNMAVIEHLYNLFSFGDPVQTVSGYFERVLPPHPRITNIALTCNGSRPNHAGLHAPLVAQWLTALPTLCTHEEMSAYTTSMSYGSLNLFDHQQPLYSVDIQLPRLLENEKKLYATLSSYLLPREKKSDKEHCGKLQKLRGKPREI